MSVNISSISGASILALYKKPADPSVFNEYYEKHHAPLAKTMPGLVSYTIGHGGENDPYYLVAILTFESQAALTAALGSSQGAATVADLQNFAQAGVDVLTFPNLPA